MSLSGTAAPRTPGNRSRPHRAAAAAVGTAPAAVPQLANGAEVALASSAAVLGHAERILRPHPERRAADSVGTRLQPMSDMAESDRTQAEIADAARASVLIADNEAATREPVALVLRAHPEFRVCAEVSDAAAAVEAALRERPDVCLLDIRIPGDGIAATREITSRLRSTKTVIFARSSEEGELFAALEAGACGFLPKETDPARLPAILRDVVSGTGAALPRRLVLGLIEEFNSETVPLRRQPITESRTTQLTSREWQVLQLLRRGLSTGDIARHLFLSEATVRSHSATLVRKLGVRDREAAIRLFDN